MSRMFNVSGDCRPEVHYMVDISDKVKAIKEMVDKGQYFTINRARQYGKTTTLRALTKVLKRDYTVINLNFQMMSSADFKSEDSFVGAMARELLKRIQIKDEMPEEIKDRLQPLYKNIGQDRKLAELFLSFSEWCNKAKKPLVLIIDEVDSATNNQVFLDFLAQLRAYYLERDEIPTFHSVILAGVYDIKNLKLKFVPENEHRQNSPWNIAADFLVDMSFSSDEITGMLNDYEKDHNTGMDTELMADLIYEYTGGYPFLVSRICKLLDERIYTDDERKAWTKEGFLEAMRILLNESNPLFESLLGKLNDYPELDRLIYRLLFQGVSITYNPDNQVVQIAKMFGFVKVDQGTVVMANRIFETRLYNKYLSDAEIQNNDIYENAVKEKDRFIRDGHLNMKLVLERFIIHFDDIYGDQDQKFLEEDGRRHFLLF